MTNFDTDPALQDSVNPDIIAWCANAKHRLAENGIGTEGWTRLSRNEMYDRFGRIVGDTPIEAVPELPGVYSKLEYLNPSGSHYDRVTLDTLRVLERRGFIKPGDEVRDITSGSGGISVALHTILLGYKARIGHPQELPASRIFPMKFFGAELVNTGPGYIQTASDFQAAEIGQLKDSPDWDVYRLDDRNERGERVNRPFLFINRETGQPICYLNNSENSISRDAHRVLAREMIAQMIEPPAALLIAEGNWTTINGIATEIRKHRRWDETKIICVAPDGQGKIDNFGMMVPGLTMPLRFRDASLVDRQMYISDTDREDMRVRINANRIPERRVGNSTLLLYAATQQLGVEGRTLTIAYDQEMRY